MKLHLLLHESYIFITSCHYNFSLTKDKEFGNMNNKNLRTIFTLVCLLTLTLGFFTVAQTVSQILTAIKAAQIIENQLAADIMDEADKILRYLENIVELRSERGKLIQQIDELRYIANEYYTEYCGAMAAGNSESASYAWDMYWNAELAIRYWRNERLYWVEYDLWVYEGLRDTAQEKLLICEKNFRRNLMKLIG